MITSEYSVLVKDGETIQKILPNVEFDSIAPGCTVTAFARIKDGDKTIELAPGSITPEVTKEFKDIRTVQDLREACIAASITFKKKATKAELLKLLC